MVDEGGREEADERVNLPVVHQFVKTHVSLNRTEDFYSFVDCLLDLCPLLYGFD